MVTETTETRPPLPPFTMATATRKVRAAEDLWNTRNPEMVALAYSPESQSSRIHRRPPADRRIPSPKIGRTSLITA